MATPVMKTTPIPTPKQVVMFELSDPQDELALDELPDDQLPPGSQIAKPCYAYQTNGYHFKNVETMKARYYRAVNKWVSFGDMVPVPTHFLCQHCMKRHSIDIDGVNSFVFDYPFSFRKSQIYDDLINGKISGTGSAGDSSYTYNSFSANVDFDLWKDILAVNPPL